MAWMVKRPSWDQVYGNAIGTQWERDGKGACSHGEREANPWAKRRGWLALLLLARSWTPRGSNSSSNNNKREKKKEKWGNRYGRTQHPIASPRLAIAPAVASGRDRSGHQPYPTLAGRVRRIARPTERSEARQGRNAGAAGARGGAGAQRRNGFLGHSAEVQGL